MAGIQLDAIPLNGRSLEEYRAIFGLDLRKLAGKRILDAAAGPASFSLEAAQAGAQAIALDPAYALGADRILALSMAQIADIRQKITPVTDRYRWSFYKDPEDLRRRREDVTRRFIDDISRIGGPARYLAAALPRLPFADGAFHMTLCSHFLFLFSDRLDYQFHLAALLELARVTQEEALVYPVVGMDGKPYAHMNRLLTDLAAHNVKGYLAPTEFEFLRGAKHLLRITKAA
ncbi:MAG: hypothetical protein OEV92_10915 [Nitrospinota bacterium]|nr:hypothetical protein [Nitrospinota bacterium]